MLRVMDENHVGSGALAAAIIDHVLFELVVKGEVAVYVDRDMRRAALLDYQELLAQEIIRRVAVGFESCRVSDIYLIVEKGPEVNARSRPDLMVAVIQAHVSATLPSRERVHGKSAGVIPDGITS